jgi:hypothetical protein
VENGLIELIADGRMRTIELATDLNLPGLSLEAINQMHSVDTPDDRTVVIYGRAPYYEANAAGLRALVKAAESRARYGAHEWDVS